MSFDTLKQPESNQTDFANFTDEQVDAVVIYIAKIARKTKTEYGLSEEKKKERIDKFMAIMNSWPAEFRRRVQARILDESKSYEKTKQPCFWQVPADAMIAATRAVELG